jgi:hypothetical protein
LHALARLSSEPFPIAGAASTGLRQAFALLEGAVRTGETMRIEARLAQRRVAAPFAAEDRPEPLRRLSLTGLPAAERLAENPRGALLDIET